MTATVESVDLSTSSTPATAKAALKAALETLAPGSTDKTGQIVVGKTVYVFKVTV